MGAVYIAALVFTISEDANETILTNQIRRYLNLITYILVNDTDVIPYWRSLLDEARLRANYHALYVTLLIAHMLKESILNNKWHYILLRISWYKQWAWREPQHTGFCVTVHVRARLLLYVAVSRSGYPEADRIQDSAAEEEEERLCVKERLGHIASNESTREEKEPMRMPARRYRPHVLFPRLLATRVTIDSCCIAIVAW